MTRDMTIVELNVGGQMFTTTTETLNRRDSFFKGIVSTCMSHDAVWIDRDPTTFRHVLNHLRGTTTFPTDVQDLLALRQEAEFYAMPELCTSVDEEVRRRRTHSIENILSILASKLP